MPSLSKSYVEVRIEHSLNKKEEDFINNRRISVMKNLQELNIPCTLSEVPNIAVLGSGGGQRAMVALRESLVQLEEADLLDCVLYLSGVSGSTWCMASLYQQPDWSKKMETVKEKIEKQLSKKKRVSWREAYNKLKKYYKEKHFFSLTDVWAAMVVTTFVKEIDEQTLSDHWKEDSEDPYPIFTVIDKGCKKDKEGDSWVEITPHEAGYSLTGAFVDTCDFGSQFYKGSKKTPQPQMDMLYLQGVCGSALADGEEIIKYIWEIITGFFKYKTDFGIYEEEIEDPTTTKCYEVLLNLAKMYLAFLNGDVLDFEDSIIDLLKEIYKDEFDILKFPPKSLPSKEYMEQFIKQIRSLHSNSSLQCCEDILMWMEICECIVTWNWGTTYNFLYNIKDKAVPSALQKSETRDYEDAGTLNNSPYFTVLRKERDIDLIISLDFSEGDPFLTVKETAKTCNTLNIPFPEVHVPEEDVKKPKDFYVFKGQKAPTVIHIPLFNQINCGDQIEYYRERYTTFQGPYSLEKIKDLIEVAGKNISNNREKLKEEIRAAIEKK